MERFHNLMNSPSQMLPRATNTPLAGVFRRILYAEDNDSLRELAVRSLRAQGYIVVPVPDGLAAYDALRADPFDLLITDHDMPRLTGFDLISRLRLRGFNLPIIVTSGDIPLAHTPAEQLGVSCCLQKPFPMPQLLRIVRRLLNAPFSATAALAEVNPRPYALQSSHWGLNE